MALIAVIAAAALGFYGYERFTSPGPLAANKVYEIGKGQGTPEIGRELEEQGIISSASVFTAAAYLTGARGHLKAGEYEFQASATMRDVMNLLVSGKSIVYKLSVPEGFTSDMALARVNDNPILTGDPATSPPEGSIMPDTYVFKRGMTRDKLIEDMQAAQVKLLAEVWATRKPGIAVKTPEEAVTLASIVEKETALANERPLIASVFMNRLKKGMRLQSDPTIIYGIVGGKGKLDRALTKTDITTPTPYNTYTINGLPPGPIANPGRAALEAVVNPPDTNYLYFVADGTGGHAFASTLEEHNRNVAKWRDLAGNAAAAAAESEAEAVAQAAQVASPTPDTSKQATLPAIESTDAAPVPRPDASAAQTADQAKPQDSVPIDPPPEAKSTTAEPPKVTPPADTKTATTEQPAEAAPAETKTPAPATDTPPVVLKPGSVVKVAGQLVPIPRRKPKHLAPAKN
jgi:UPF0755 protein